MANCAVCGKAIHIEDQIEFGNQTSNVLAAKLTEHLENYMYVLPV